MTKQAVKTGTKQVVKRGARTSRGIVPGSRPGKNFTREGKDIVITKNARKFGGVNRCEGCVTKTTKPSRVPKGGKRAKTETNVDHITSKKNGGSGTPENGQVLCLDCNLKKGSND
ncbi:MAG: HNH endonuclease [Acidobacteria bacterium]|nr:HNH endonuclease [Acidobacteriota bacterium]